MSIRFLAIIPVVGAALVLSAAQEPEPLARLTPPAGTLPAGCALRPVLGGLKDPLYGHNPAIVSDSLSLAVVHMFAAGAGITAEKPVAAAYSAFYKEEGGSPQLGVYAIRYRRDLTTAEADAFKAVKFTTSSSPLRVVKGPLAIYLYSNSRPDAQDKGCYDALKKHIESVLVGS
jgi:hypothetical protein